MAYNCALKILIIFNEIPHLNFQLELAQVYSDSYDASVLVEIMQCSCRDIPLTYQIILLDEPINASMGTCQRHARICWISLSLMDVRMRAYVCLSC